jgi:lysophospholipase L1-like esterase
MKQRIGLLAVLGVAVAAYSAPHPQSSESPKAWHCVLNETRKPSVLHDLGEMKFEAFTDDSIVFDASEGDLTDPVLYDARTDNFHYDGLYRLRNTAGEWRFRIGAQEFDARTRFFHVQWEQGYSPQQSGIYRVEALKDPRVSATDVSISMVGDSITWAGYGQRLRCEMLDAGFKWHFVGRHLDSFGLAHEGEGGNTTMDVLARIAKVPASSRYFLLIGTNDVSAPPNETFNNILRIAYELSHKRKGAKVYISTLLPRSDNNAANRRNDRVNSLLRKYFNACEDCQAFILVDTAQAMHGHDDWQTLLVDGLHPGIAGYRFLAEYWVRTLH